MKQGRMKEGFCSFPHHSLSWLLPYREDVMVFAPSAWLPYPSWVQL